ncbi:MAG: hypothetical protein M3154_03395, partial [Candidatus Eremiobacteraeota bacterium]|nr:hypothetical protein [Candidatus Eremiobacteraeota bacterium]
MSATAGVRDAQQAAPRARRVARWIARWIAGGSVLAMVAATPYRLFELDRFFVPKEVVLLLVATIACWAAAGLVGDDASPDDQTRGPGLDRVVDTALALYLAGSTASALLAPSGWLAARALAISGSGATLFW